MTTIPPSRITASLDAVIRDGVFESFWYFYKCAVSIDTVDPAFEIAGESYKNPIRTEFKFNNPR